ncbi:MAG: sugar phosphate isomerase/epimerase [Sporolactobacillus sp.]|jgi:sugar phosphate isomerase/epimerase|nr:sugar phosphate isomerase/epimerase [Sporolactobacillus sp.]
MDPERIVLNTLVYEKDHKEGKSQAQLIEKAADTGVKNVEIRREYNSPSSAEIPQMKKAADKYGIQLLYSIPGLVFKNGQVAEADLNAYLQEAQQLGCQEIKLNIGDYKDFKGNLAQALKPFTEKGIRINVENDQSQENGTLRPIKTFLQDCASVGVPIGYVYDIVNWYFVGEDPSENAKQLAPFTKYIHLKDVKRKPDGSYVVAPLNKGEVDWQSIVKLLPEGLNVAIEYPCAGDQEVHDGLQILKELDY